MSCHFLQVNRQEDYRSTDTEAGAAARSEGYNKRRPETTTEKSGRRGTAGAELQSRPRIHLLRRQVWWFLLPRTPPFLFPFFLKKIIHFSPDGVEWRAPFLVFSVDLVIRVVLPFLDLSCGNRALPHWSYRLVGGAEPPIWVEGLTNLRNILTALYNSDNRCTTGAQKQKNVPFLNSWFRMGFFFLFGNFYFLFLPDYREQFLQAIYMSGHELNISKIFTLLYISYTVQLNWDCFFFSFL